MTDHSHPVKSNLLRITGRSAFASGLSRPDRKRVCPGQAMVEFAIISTVALTLMLVGVQYALLGQAAVAVSQGSSALARFGAENPGVNLAANGKTAGNGPVTLTAAVKQLLSPTILTGSNDGDLTVTIASVSAATGTTTDTPQQGDQLTVTLTYGASSKIVLSNPFLGIVGFPTSFTVSDSEMYQ